MAHSPGIYPWDSGQRIPCPPRDKSRGYVPAPTRGELREHQVGAVLPAPLPAPSALPRERGEKLKSFCWERRHPGGFGRLKAGRSPCEGHSRFSLHGHLPFCHRNRFAHCRRAENSGAHGPDRDRLRGASDLPPGASHLPRGASDLTHRANDLPCGASDLPHGANDLPPGATDLPRGASGLTHGASDLPRGANDLPPGANDPPRGAIGSTRGDCDGGMRGAGRRHDERETPERERDGRSTGCSDPRGLAAGGAIPGSAGVPPAFFKRPYRLADRSWVCGDRHRWPID